MIVNNRMVGIVEGELGEGVIENVFYIIQQPTGFTKSGSAATSEEYKKQKIRSIKSP